jgi:hypothetical protein
MENFDLAAHCRPGSCLLLDKMEFPGRVGTLVFKLKLKIEN